MAITKDYANSVLTALFKDAFIGLSSTEPTDAGENITEPGASKGYARTAASAGAFEAVDGHIKNTAYIYFPLATENWGELPYLCIFDGNAVDSKLRYFGALTNAQAIVADTIPLFRPNMLEVYFTE